MTLASTMIMYQRNEEAKVLAAEALRRLLDEEEAENETISPYLENREMD